MKKMVLTAIIAFQLAETLIAQQQAAAATIIWAGHTWNVTTGGMAGVAQGSASNVVVDANGYLHLKITNNAGAWTAAELFTTDKLGFGTYQWQIDGAVDRLDKNVVVGLYPYGPAAGIGNDGTNEIDIEYARWGNSAWDNGNWTVYPSSGSAVGSSTYMFSLNGGTSTTSTFVWSSTSIAFRSQAGFKAIGDTSGTINKWTYAPSNPGTNLPQQALPLGMNLWCYQAPPSDGQNVEIIIRSFQFIAIGTGEKTDKTKRISQAFNTFGLQTEGKTIRLNEPVKQDMLFEILDIRGRVVRAVEIPAGASTISLTGLGTAAHLARFVSKDFSQKALFVY
jgi:hypothetical protein